MTTLSIQEFCAAVYCAIAPCDAIPRPPGERLIFDATTEDGNTPQRLRLEFEGLRDFSRRVDAGRVDRPCEPGDLLELSVVEVEGRPGAWRVWFNPWYLTEIEFWCTGIRLNGLEVTGSGRWVQDDLPSSSPALPEI